MNHQKPMEIKIADELFIRMNPIKKHFQVTDLTEKYVHYSFWSYGSIVDFHKTINPHDDHPKQHIPIFKRQLDLDLLTRRIVEVISKDSTFQIGKVDDSRWRDLDIEYIPTSTLMELLPTLVKGQRLNFNKDFLARFENLLQYAKLKDLIDTSILLGKSSEGHYIVSSGTDCFVFDTDLLSEIIERNLQSLIIQGESSKPS